MKLKRFLLIVSVFAISFGAIAQTKNTNASQSKSQKLTQKVQTLEQNIQEQILHIQVTLQDINEILQKQEKEIEVYREDVRTKTSEMNTNMNHWLCILTILVAILGIGAPLYLNYRNDKQQKDKLDQLAEQVKASNNALTKIENIEKTIHALEDNIKKSEMNAQQSAKRALANKFFTEALAESKNKPQKAIELYTKVIELDDTNIGAYNNRGNLKRKIKDLFSAMLDYNKAIEIDPEETGSYNNRGSLRKELGDIQGALEDYNRVIQIDPNFADVYNNRADLWLLLGELDKALQDVNYAIIQNASDDIFYVTKGEIYLAMKNYNEAILQFNQALSLNKNNEEAYIHRAECYRKLANKSRNKTKKAEYIALAELDDAKINQLKNKND